MTLLTLDDIAAAAKRIQGQVTHPPLVTSTLLNQWLGHRFYFKAENLQKVGAFKARGAYNTLAWLSEQGQLPQHIVAYSSGNHAQAVAWAAHQFGINATIVMPHDVSKIKAQATAAYGAKIVFSENRAQAQQLAGEMAAAGAYLVPPYDHDQIICGQGTAVYEALLQQPAIDAVFVPCGGGGLLSGSVISAKGLSPNIKVFGAEPTNADDAARSLQTGQIISLPQSPTTIADGVKTLAISERTFTYLQQCDGILTIDETAIIYWTQWLTHLLKLTIEPTSALGMAAACQWLKGQTTAQGVLVVLSGGNLDQQSQQQVWQQDFLDQPPSLS